MVFSSIVFLLFFLPVVLLVYYAIYFIFGMTSRKSGWIRPNNFVLLGFSLVFYFWGENFLIWILFATTLTDYVCALLISGALWGGEVKLLAPGESRTTRQKAALFVSIFSNLAMLAFFKYFNFGMDVFNSVAPELWKWKSVPHIALPLGISFYTFQSMSYTIDVYRGDVRATRNVIDYLCCVTMFPHMVAGPIVRYRALARQAVRRVLTVDKFSSGVRTFIIGLSKKVLIANTSAVAADGIFALEGAQLTTGLAWTGVAAYTLQIYFDFSGYSDMAIGLGRMMGFELPKNFNYPYTALSIKDFWRRWHITLSTWFRDYLYIPLGGNRFGEARSYFNLVAVFLLCGLWHGASWNFIVWGAYHGVFLVFERTRVGQFLDRLWRPLRHAYVLMAILVGWVFFRATDLPHALVFLSAMSGFGRGDGLVQHVWLYLTPETMAVMAAGIVGSAPLLQRLARFSEGLLRGFADRYYVAAHRLATAAGLTVLAALYLTGLSYLATGSYNPFIYFRF